MNRRKKRQEEKLAKQALLEEEERQVAEVVQTLKEIPLLSNLKNEELRALAASFQLRTYSVGETVMEAGKTGDEFFFINAGTADVLMRGDDGEFSKIASLRSLDYFGEQALLTDSVRCATIKATSDLECLVLNRQQFKSLNKSGEIMFAQRAAVMAEDFDSSAPDPFDHSEEHVNFIKESIKTNMLFASHEEKIIDDIVQYFHPEEKVKNDVIIQEGDDHANHFYVILEGECTVSTEKNGDVCELGEGKCFGELALLYNAPRNATVKVKSDTCKIFVMERRAFRHVIIDAHKANDDQNFAFLRGVKLFQPLLANEITLIDMALTARNCEPGETIFKQGDAPDKFYLVKEGQCDGIATKEDGSTEPFIKNVGSFFGELALLNDEVRSATITAGENGCSLLTLTREDFTHLLGPLRNILDRNAEEYQKPPNDRKLIDEDANKICELDELKTIGLLGRGAFGKVTLVVDPHTKKSYALKAIKKTQIEEIGQSAHIVNEKRVMMMMNSRFLVNLRRTYKDPWRVYFLVDVCLGGELFTILRKKRSFNEDFTRFYAGCVVEAFSYMHGMDIVYRDLKPENLVMDNSGYIKVTDFGFAKVVPKKTYTLCGTPDYLAPEIVTGQGHGKGVDWWCLGVLIYELLSSFPPFFDDEPMGTYRKIIQGKFKFPKYFSADARDLIARLLRTRPTKRLAVMKGGADNIRNHSWYKGFEWDMLREGELTAPWKPEVKSFDDISNFDQRDKRKSAADTGKPPKTPWDGEF